MSLKRAVTLFVLLFLSEVTLFAQQRAFWAYFDGNSSYLGVAVEEITKENYSKYGLGSVQGVAVEEVIANSPAERAGIKQGDVIIRFNNEEVTSVRKLMRLISEVAPDHQVKITVLRKGKEYEFNVVVGKRRDLKPEDVRVMIPRLPEKIELPLSKIEIQGDGNLFFIVERRIGVDVVPLTKQLGEYFGISDGKGVLVTQVDPDSPAAKAGIRAGDIIVEIDDKKVSDWWDLRKAINSKSEGDVRITIVREKQRQIITVTPEKLNQTESGSYYKKLEQNRKIMPEPLREMKLKQIL